ncbi:MAG: 2-hydroxyacid dehydrogenase [Thermoplasmata archaeon]
MTTLLATVRLNDGERQVLERAATHHPVVYFHELKGSPDEVLPEVEVLLCAGLRDFTPSMMRRMTSLRLVQTLLAGADHIAYELFRRDMVVCTTSGAGSHHVAEHAFALLIAAAKNLVSHTLSIREGRFDRSPRNLPLKGMTLGIVGFGNVGRIVGSLGRASGMRIHAINHSGETQEPVEFIGTLKDLSHLLRNVDYLVICLPLTGSTEGLIGQEELQAMKQAAVLVNVGRARVVQEEALYRHLKANPHFRGAFDVWWTYPSGEMGRPFNLPFHELRNFIMTPHVGGNVSGHRKEMMRFAIENIGNYFMDKPLSNRIEEEDFPPEAVMEG